jgi:hypothetical protein
LERGGKSEKDTAARYESAWVRRFEKELREVGREGEREAARDTEKESKVGW